MEINPKYSLEGMILKLKLQNLGHLIQRPDAWEKTLVLGKIEDKQRSWQRMRWLGSITDSMGMNLRKFLVIAKDRGACCAAELDTS